MFPEENSLFSFSISLAERLQDCFENGLFFRPSQYFSTRLGYFPACFDDARPGVSFPFSTVEQMDRFGIHSYQHYNHYESTGFIFVLRESS
ncbi:hypothetical protein CI610_02903 [invertebrate metagenome]|uniref:Uncharacterized protein n=1 Tax=invertebrate metagenome TaxID=1711999 RepID=A0A2H9T4M4_9ZZZZ